MRRLPPEPEGEQPFRESQRDRRRRHTRGSLAWSLVVSLLTTHVALLPAVRLLLRGRPMAPGPIEVELIEPPPKKDEKKLQLPRLAQRQRQQQVARRRKAPAPPRAVKPPPKKEPKKRKKLVKRPPPAIPRPQPPEPPRLKMVEINTPESKTAPKNARFLSDKNRRVAKETRARHTNLQRDHRKPEPTPSKALRRKIDGAAKPQLARKAQKARPRRQPRRKPVRVSPLLAMRRPAQRAIHERTEIAKNGSLAAAQPLRRAAAPRRRLDLNLDHQSLDRMYGKAAHEARERARLAVSPRRGGKIERKWKRMRAALENFVPEVQPGNQTALGTRANPFAVYIARMHRKIHPLWGYGFLVDLDNKGDRNPLNDMSLRTTLEVAVNPDGSIAKATIVRPSGKLVFDVAALDSVFSAGAFDATPRGIRSANGKVYMHWSFYRNHRQCGTFNVHPYILTTPPSGPVDGQQRAALPLPGRRLRRLNGRGPLAADATAVGPRGFGGATRQHQSGRHTRHHRHRYAPPPEEHRLTAKERRRRQRIARAAARRFVSSADPRARAATERLLAAFRRGDAGAMARACALPFGSRGKVVAKRRDELERMFTNLLRETPSRGTTPPTVLTLGEARRKLGGLPRGARHGAEMLVARTSLGGTAFTLTLQRQQGSWRIIALDR